VIKLTDAGAVSIQDFIDENWEQFSALESAAEEELTRISRELPAEFHEMIREQILKSLISSIPIENEKAPSNLKVKLIIDANIIVQDCFRVAVGKLSSTERIFSSPYLDVVAPDIIQDEVERIIREKLPEGASLKKALSHARKLISRLKISSNVSSKAIDSARYFIEKHSSEDIQYLAMAIDHEADAIVSRDKRAFDAQPMVKRYELGEAVVISVTYESGALSLLVLGASAEIIGRALEKLVIAIIQIFETVLEIIATLIVAIVEKSFELISKIPTWAWIIIVSACIGVLILAIFHEGFRDGLGEVANAAASFLADLANAVMETGKVIWNAFKNILIWLWNFILPVLTVILVVAGVLFKRVVRLLDEEIAKGTKRNSVLDFKTEA
jgi:predicted nucleic acid-binding protein